MLNQEVRSDRCQVLVIGGGISGAWLAYRLAQRRVPTILISADHHSPAVSRRAAALIDQSAVDCDTRSAPAVFADTSATQAPDYQSMMVERARLEFDELNRLVKFMSLGAVLVPSHPVRAPRLGAGREVLDTVLAQFEELGGTRRRGLVTDLVVDSGICYGVRYQDGDAPGKILSRDIVLASGGISGAFADGVLHNTGALLGTYARNGGTLANLEFFTRHALGDLTHKRPLYPDDLVGGRLLRAGGPATDLAAALAQFAGPTVDLDVFRHYWRDNLDVPHTAELAAGTIRLGPIRGFSMGGMAWKPSGAALGNVHGVGECIHDVALDSVTGRPWLSFIARAGELAEALCDSGGDKGRADFDAGEIVAPTDPALTAEIGRRLQGLSDHLFSSSAAEDVVRWCRRERQHRRAGRSVVLQELDRLILVEAYALSADARRESRGFFSRPDYPKVDADLTSMITNARYDEDDDRVSVVLAANERSAHA